MSDNAMISVYPFGDEIYAFTEGPVIHRQVHNYTIMVHPTFVEVVVLSIIIVLAANLIGVIKGVTSKAETDLSKRFKTYGLNHINQKGSLPFFIHSHQHASIKNLLVLKSFFINFRIDPVTLDTMERKNLTKTLALVNHTSHPHVMPNGKMHGLNSLISFN